MQFTSPLVKGQLLRRYKRFFADVLLDCGQEVTAHCPNTGAMTGCAESGFTVWLSQSDNPKRKLKYTWELAQDREGHWIGINTNRANRLVEEALIQGNLEPFNQYSSIRREFKPIGANSRFDFQLTPNDDTDYPSCLLEVKSVTLNDKGHGYFPDAVTTRGTKHCLELADRTSNKQRCSLLFCVQHTGINDVNVAEHIDPDYAQALRYAKQRGVDIVAYGCEINDKKIFINQRLNIVL